MYVLLSYIIEDAYKGFKFSKPTYVKVTESSPLYSVDCEMVITEDSKFSLASVCVVDENLSVVYKTLVKPDQPVKDYVTRLANLYGISYFNCAIYYI